MKNSYEIKKIELFFYKYSVSKKSILLFFENYESGIIRELKNNISHKAFENLFFKQFYFLLKNKKFILFFESCICLLENKKVIINLLSFYHYELILRDYTDGKSIFREEIYSILAENILYMSSLNISYEDGICHLFDLVLFTLNNGASFIDIKLSIDVYDNTLDIQDYQNGASLNIFSGLDKIYNLSFYISKNELFISNLQYGVNMKNYVIVQRFSKTLLYIILNICEKLGIKDLISFSNENHPCRSHKINDGFKGDYNNICTNIGMELGKDGYFHGNIKKLAVKKINTFIKKNIDYNLGNINKALNI